MLLQHRYKTSCQKGLQHRNGLWTTNVALNIPMRPDGSIEDACVTMCKFSPQDIRFTVGKDNALYAFCMAVPQPGQTITIGSLAKGTRKVKSVALLGYQGKLKWKQSSEGLNITCPQSLPCLHSVVFCIE